MHGCMQLGLQRERVREKALQWRLDTAVQMWRISYILSVTRGLKG